MDQEKQVPISEILQREINQLRDISSRQSSTISILSQELTFWKKLALSNLGVDSQKINELVQFSGNGLGSVGALIGNTLSRGY